MPIVLLINQKDYGLSFLGEGLSINCRCDFQLLRLRSPEAGLRTDFSFLLVSRLFFEYCHKHGGGLFALLGLFAVVQHALENLGVEPPAGTAFEKLVDDIAKARAVRPARRSNNPAKRIVKMQRAKLFSAKRIRRRNRVISRIRKIFTYLYVYVSFRFLSDSCAISCAATVPSFLSRVKSTSALGLQEFLCPAELLCDAFMPDNTLAELELFRDSLPDFFELFDADAIADAAQCPRIERAFAVVGCKQQNQAAIYPSLGRRELNKVDIRQKRIAL